MPDKLIPGEKKAPIYKKSGFKMKGNPMQRNFGIGKSSPTTKKPTVEEQIAAADKQFREGVKVKQYSKEEVKDAKQLKRKRKGDTRVISKEDIEKAITYHKKSGGKPAETARQEARRLASQ